jgi:hypothetical protein
MSNRSQREKTFHRGQGGELVSRSSGGASAQDLEDLLGTQPEPAAALAR